MCFFQSLEGLSLRQLEESIFFFVAPDIQLFTNLHSLDIQDCNIYLKEGITRSRTFGRSRLCETFSVFSRLRRLDLSFNYLIGCLGELLGALQSPLEYLSVRGCDLNETDLKSLSQSKHAQSLRELDISKLCQFSIYESDRISPACTLEMIKHFPNMTVLNISQNNLPDSGMKDFGQTLRTHLPRLKGLDISGNIMQFESQLELTKACAQIPMMQWIRLTCMNTSLNGGLENNQVVDLMNKLNNAVKQYGREDICIDVMRLSFAILVDLIDFLD